MSDARTHETRLHPSAQPDVFERTAFIVCEIEEIAVRSVGQMVRLRAARLDGDRQRMHEAACELVKIFHQGRLLAESTVRALAHEGGV